MPVSPRREPRMLTPDVNVLIYAHRAESPDHERYAAWLAGLAQQREAFALSDVACTGFVRVVTHPRLWRSATPSPQALEFIERLRRRRACRLLAASAATWATFAQLVAATDARGKLVADAWLAALAIENGCTLATCDSDFARFPGLRWVHPLQPA